jgi:hypothetical protein
VCIWAIRPVMTFLSAVWMQADNHLGWMGGG